MPLAMQIIVQWSMPAGSVAVIASGEYHMRNMRSMNHCSDQKPVEIIIGKAMCSTSRPPQGRVHQVSCIGLGSDWCMASLQTEEKAATATRRRFRMEGRAA